MVWYCSLLLLYIPYSDKLYIVLSQRTLEETTMKQNKRTRQIMPKNFMPESKTPQELLHDLCDLTVTDGVAIVTEFSTGAEYFDTTDAETLIESLRRIPELTGVLLDGFTSVHRPSILNDRVVAYNWTEEQVVEHLLKVPKEEHVHWMYQRLLESLEEWLKRFRTALPGKKIVYSADGVNLHSTAERMLRVIVQSRALKIRMQRQELDTNFKEHNRALNGVGKGNAKGDRQALRELKTRLDVVEHGTDSPDNKKRIRNLKRQMSRLEDKIELIELGLKVRIAKREEERQLYQGVRGKTHKLKLIDIEIDKLKSEVAEHTNAIGVGGQKIEAAEKELSHFRDPETSPNYQRRVNTHVRDLIKGVRTICKRHNIDFIFRPSVISFGTMTMHYANNRGRTWTPMSSRGKKLAEAFQSTIASFRANVKVTMEEQSASGRELDLVVEGGSHGVFFARWQRDHITDEEAGMHHVNSFYTGGSDGVRHTMYLTVPPFEDQQKIAKYTNRGKPARTRLGKTQGTASHPVFIRAEKSGVSGITVVRKHHHGLLSVEPVAYALFKDKSVLKPFHGVATIDDSDNHFNSPEMDALGTLGTVALLERLMSQPLHIHGTDVYVGSHHSLGDTGEANSRAWKEGHKYREWILSAIDRILRDTVTVDQSVYESVMEAVMRHANDMMGGSNENLKLTQRAVDDYFWKMFRLVMKSPQRLRDIHVSVTGNHFDNVTRDAGVQEHDAFEQRLRVLREVSRDFPESGFDPFRLAIIAGGEPRPHPEDDDEVDTRVHLYGYSTARSGTVPDFGVGYDGSAQVQMPIKLGVIHEPNNMASKARNMLSDVIKAGHTHESYLMADKSGDNTFRILDQKPTTQRVTSTELVYGGIPRTAGVDLTIVSRPGRYWKMTIPMEHMRRIGLAWIFIKVDEEIREKAKSK
jgi:hypothetical protein